MSTSKQIRFVILIILLLIAFALRVYRLGDVNVWWDEAYSVWLARMSLADAVKITAGDVHPPLYYTLLNPTIRLFGNSEFAIRYLSVLPGLLTAPLLYLLGKKLIDSRWAMFLLGWLAVSRFHIWWSQETRMYTWAAFWAVWVFYFLWRLMEQGDSGNRSPRGRPYKWSGLAYLLGMSAGLYTLYLFGLVYLAVGLTVMMLWLSHRISSRMFAQWVLITAVSLLLYLPWVLYATPNQPGQTAANNSIVHLIQLYLTLLVNGESTNLAQFSLWAGGLMFIAAAGFIGLALKKRFVSLAYLFPAFVLPPVMAIILLLISKQVYTPAIEARYFLLMAPLNLLGLTAALAAVASFRQRTAVVLSVLVIGLAVHSLPGYYQNRHLRDQWKSAVTMIRAYAHPQDRVLLVSGDRYPLFLYEYDKWQGERPSVHLIPDGAPAIHAENVVEQMQKTAADSERIWLVEIERNMQDPQGLSRKWLEEHYFASFSINYEYNRLTLFTRDGKMPPENPKFTHASVTVPLTEFWPGDTVHLGIMTSAPDSCLQIVHESGLIMVSHSLAEPVSTFIDVPWLITQAVPNGRYHIQIDGQETVAVHINNSDPLWQLDDIPELISAHFGAIHLLGYELEPQSPSPGDTIQLDLYWQIDQPVATDFTVFTQIVGPFNPQSGNPLWGQHDGPPVSGTYPTTTWPIGLIIRDRHLLTFSPEATNAEYTLLVGLYDSKNGDRLTLTDDKNGADAFDLFSFSVKEQN
ncbi:MAG: glycosyltransferase family 39 protein [Anaerolineae bacterium]